MITPENNATLSDVLHTLVGMPCWYVNAGGRAGSSFSLSLGQKVSRKYALKNRTAGKEFREFEGGATLLIWCSWRLDRQDDTESSSDESADAIAQKLGCLVGQTIRQIEASGRANDLTITFERSRLSVFCDHVPGDPSFDGNWQIEHRGRLLVAGPGFRVREG